MMMINIGQLVFVFQRSLIINLKLFPQYTDIAQEKLQTNDEQPGIV